MILEALTCITEEMNDHFRSKLKIKEDKVILSALVNPDGTMAVQGENKIIVTLVHVEKENTVRSPRQKGIGFQNSPQSIFPPLDLNILVLFSSYFSNDRYAEALKFTSEVIEFFRQKSVFTKANSPKLDDKIEKLVFEIVEFNAYTLSSVWSAMGAKYMPSVIFKIRMLSFDENND